MHFLINWHVLAPFILIYFTCFPNIFLSCFSRSLSLSSSFYFILWNLIMVGGLDTRATNNHIKMMKYIGDFFLYFFRCCCCCCHLIRPNFFVSRFSHQFRRNFSAFFFLLSILGMRLLLLLCTGKITEKYTPIQVQLSNMDGNKVRFRVYWLHSIITIIIFKNESKKKIIIILFDCMLECRLYMCVYVHITILLLLFFVARNVFFFTMKWLPKFFNISVQNKNKKPS